MTRRLVWSSAAHSHVGMVRSVNEDACVELPSLGLWAVADGMGGHEAGDVAAQMIIDALRAISPPPEWQDYIQEVKRILRQVNHRLREESARHYHNRTIGSTVVVLLLRGEQMAWLWVGDSRIYRLRGERLEQLTRDHSHVQDLVEQGLLSASDAIHHPMANVITRAVGSADTLDIDAQCSQVQPGDVFLLCSDGLNKVISDAEIQRVLASRNSQKSVRALIHSALLNGAHDNVTTAVITVSEEQRAHEEEEKTIPTAEYRARQAQR